MLQTRAAPRPGPQQGRRAQQLTPGADVRTIEGGKPSSPAGTLKGTGVAVSVAATVPVKSHCPKRVDSLWCPPELSLVGGGPGPIQGERHVSPHRCPLAPRPALDPSGSRTETATTLAG